MTDAGYIYVCGWDDFQHYRDRRPSWIKLHTDLVDNEAYLELPMRDRALLVSVWMLTALNGNGRVYAEPKHLARRLRSRYAQLDRLIEAGFIEVRASKALSPSYPKRSNLDHRGSSKEEPKRGASAHAENGALRATENTDPADRFTPAYIAELERVAHERDQQAGLA